MYERSVCIKDMALYIHLPVLSCVTVSFLCYCTHCVMSTMIKAVFVIVLFFTR